MIFNFPATKILYTYMKTGCKQYSIFARQLVSVNTNHVRQNSSSSIKHVTLRFENMQADIGYLDIGPPQGPLILGIHGVPGSHLDFSPLLDPLVDAGFRVIIPNYPGFGISSIVCKSGRFSHSTDDRAELTFKFIEALHLGKIPGLIGFSGGGHLAFKLAATSGIFQSVMALSAAAHRPQQTARPLWCIRFLAWGQEVKLVEPIFRKMLTFGYKKVGFTVEDPQVLQTSVKTVARSDFPGTQISGETICVKKMPLLFVCSKSDRIVEWNITEEYSKITGVPEQNFTIYDKEGIPAHDPHKNTFRNGVFAKTLIFERGGHHVHKVYSAEIMKHFMAMVKSLQVK